MSAVQSIQRLGFRRWYERQLIEGHAYLVTSFLSAIVAAACLEMVLGGGDGRRLKAVVALGALLVSWFAGKGYLSKLAHAEQWAKHAVCPKCQVYERFAVVTSGIEQGQAATWARVQCKKCQAQWVIREADND